MLEQRDDETLRTVRRELVRLEAQVCELNLTFAARRLLFALKAGFDPL